MNVTKELLEIAANSLRAAQKTAERRDVAMAVSDALTAVYEAMEAADADHGIVAAASSTE